MLDLRIVGGTLVDGSGDPSRPADIGIEAGKVVVVSEPGSLPDAVRTIDATGRLVTPGFVDPHTHMDAQLWWEPSGAPSVLHGVTTVVIGSCGFGVAPLAKGDEEYVLRSLESVEEIPYEATREALPMSWQSWTDYFEQLGDLPLGVNVAGFVPHSALRAGVLGDARQQRDLTTRQRADLRAALSEALSAGAVGMSTSRGTNHTDAVGRPMPSREASDEELVELISLCAGRAWQINIASKGDASDEGVRRALEELGAYDDWARRTGALVTWTPLIVGPGDKVVWRKFLDFAEAHQDHSLPQVSAQPIVGAISFDGPSFAALIDGWAPAFVGYGDLTASERSERLASSEFREVLRSTPEDPARATAPNYDRWEVAASTSAPDAVALTIRELAEARGKSPVDAMIDLVLEDDLATVVEAPLSNLDQEALHDLILSPATMLGLGDAGAHVKSISNYSYPTSVVGELSRDRGWMGVERAVAELTSRPADALGLEGRGRLEVGSFADVCVIDLDRLTNEAAEVVADLPGGCKRLHRGAKGYDAVVVNGRVVVDHDQLTGADAGGLVRVSR